MKRLPLCSFLIFAGLVVTVGCRDGPGSATEPPETEPVVYELTPSLQAVSQLGSDPFVQPLLHQVIGPSATNQLTESLNSFAILPTDQTLSAAVLSLSDIQRQIENAKRTPLSPASMSDAATGGEELVIQDALGLVVDDALDQLLNVSDSTGG